MNVVYVDKNDKVIGSGTIANAVANGIIVRISRVFLFNSKGELLLQKRSDAMALPGRWDHTAAGHVDKNEDYAAAARRELLEEMGINEVKLREIATFYTEETDNKTVRKRFSKIFTGIYDGKVTIDNNEVSDFTWILPKELDKQMKQHPDNFTQGFIMAFGIYESTDRPV